MQLVTAFVTLSATDDRLVEFYEKLFARAPDPHIPGTYAEFQLERLRLAIFYPKPENQPEFADSTRSGMSLCLDVADLEAAIARCQDLGARVSAVTVASHGREAYAYDPAGNRLILHQGK